MTPGTYAWTWGTGNDADSVTLRIGPGRTDDPTAVPGPASGAILAAGLIGLLAARRRRAAVATG